MICKHFEFCGGCQTNEDYTKQLLNKQKKFKDIFGFKVDQVFSSPQRSFRNRGEFRIYRKNKVYEQSKSELKNFEYFLDQEIFLSMNALGKNQRVVIENCPNLSENLQNIIKQLLFYLKAQILNDKLYAINILGDQQVILTMIYHKKLDEVWEDEAKILAKKLNICIIGRSRNQKIIVGDEILQVELEVRGKKLIYFYREGNFSQPNFYINAKMLNFVAQNILDQSRKDLLEMYCGSGNFSIALASYFKKVLATEVVKGCLPILQKNIEKNQINNLYVARLSGAETIAALCFERDFFRLKNLDLKSFDFSHLLVDPPRSGIQDRKMLSFMQNFSYIIYISCNPISLKEDFEVLKKSHVILKSAIFDQFPHTYHMECIFILKKIK